MNQNPIDDVLRELQFTEAEKQGFMKFLRYAKTCQETGNNKQLKSQLEQIVRGIAENM
ncbi:MAG: hypothetical protein IJQ38_07945 [Bacteroidaceae bacterium]|nr:hypothetical protein [Bacteroidaceae bacterium]